MKRLATCLLLAFFAWAQGTADLELKKAKYRAEVQGDLKGAIAEYGKIASKYQKDRAVAARALMEMARCHERLGGVEARKLYEQVVKTYGEQKEIVVEAQARLVAIGGAPAPGGAILARQVYSGTFDTDGSVSPDGKLLTLATWKPCGFSVRDLSTGADRLLAAGDCNADAVPGSAFSGDGKQIAFGFCVWKEGKSKCELRVVGVDGSGLRTVAPLPDAGWAIAYGWTPDHRQILVAWTVPGSTPRESGRMIAMVDAASGAIHKVAELPRRIGPGRARLMLSPDGQWIAYPGWVEDAKPHQDVFLISARGGAARVAIGGPYNEYPLGFSVDGKSLFAASNRGTETLALKVEIENGQAKGVPKIESTGLPADAPLGVTKNGALMLARDTFVSMAFEADLDEESGKIKGDPRMLRFHLPRPGTSLFYLPDGKQAVYSSRSGARGEIGKVTVRDLETGRDRTIEGPFELTVYNSISPNGRLVIASGRRQEPGAAREDGYFLLDLETGTAKLLIDGLRRKSRPMMPHIAPDGRHAYFLEMGPDSTQLHRTIDLVTLEEKPVWPQLVSAGLVAGTPFSPDGKRVAIRRGGSELHVMGIDGTGDVRLFGSNEAKDAVVHTFVWSSDGKWIYFIRNGNKERPTRLMRVSAEGGDAQVVYEGDITYPGFSLHPSGRRISFIEGRSTQEVWALENIAR